MPNSASSNAHVRELIKIWIRLYRCRSSQGRFIQACSVYSRRLGLAVDVRFYLCAVCSCVAVTPLTTLSSYSHSVLFECFAEERVVVFGT